MVQPDSAKAPDAAAPSPKDLKGKAPANDKNAKKKEEEELSEEDQELKSQLEMLVERLQEGNVGLHRPALETFRTLIRTATSSMTSVPKPLKFLRPHYTTLTAVYERWPDSDNKHFLADILSVLAMTYSEDLQRATLRYRLLGSSEAAGSWGHEYVRHLASEIIAEYNHLTESDPPGDTAHLHKIADEIVPFFLKHNAEADACDLLLELEALDKLPGLVDRNTFERVCLYVLSMVSYVTPPDDVAILKTAHTIYRNMSEWPNALRVSMRLNDIDLIKNDFESCPDPLMKKQLAYMLARQQIRWDTGDDDINAIMNNTQLSEHFMSLARDLAVVEPKSPEEIYKSHLENIRSNVSSAQVDSARQNLASTFVNAFVNAGFRSDKLMTVNTESDTSWVYKNKDQGMMSAVASVGLINLWDLSKMNELDKYTYIDNNNIKAGALLGLSLLTSGVRDEAEAVFGLIREPEWIDHASPEVRNAAVAGIGIACAGGASEDVVETLLGRVSDTGVSMEEASLAALSLGLTFVGTCHGDIASTILQTMMEREEVQLKEPFAKFMGLGLALLFLGKQEAADAPLETLKAIEHPLAKQVEVLVEMCAYAGTGNVLKVQQMLHLCNDHLDPATDVADFQALAVLGVSLIAMGEDVGSEMSLRSFNHLMHYGEAVIRRSVPLALGLQWASNPIVQVLDLLSKYSHDNDAEVAVNAIFAMGLVGAGTNNARLGQMLRQLAAYYHKEPNPLFMVRIAQGLVHMGKGTMTINPYHSNRMLLSPVAISGLLTVLVAFTDAKTLILGKHHWLLYYLVPAMYPRFLMTLDAEADLQTIGVSVRVGQAVDVVGQAGRPKTITGFQTHTTPVLLGFTERAEMAGEEYEGLSSVLEGFVIVRKKNEE
ncbi:armadillo-type protein [Cladochytrium replicatum]|nr:armadillo-type protein [Cladochytrium replicatum]